MLLSEVHYSDLYPPSFQAFRKKYLPLLRKHKAYDLYVQFSNYADNTMDRTAFASPDHHDPVGVYGYPIAYVLNYPADIWYGKGARYLRVLQDSSRRKLDIKSIDTESKAWNLLTRMGFSYSDAGTSLKLAWKSYKQRLKGSTRWGKTFLVAMQMDLLSPPIDDGSRRMIKTPEYTIRSGVEQTKMFLKAGFDAIEDTGRNNNQAIINDREPEQIIFLTRAAFRVVEVIDLRSGTPARQLPSHVAPDPDSPRIERPFVAMIARAMDDQLSEGPDYGKYWTKQGRRIEVHFDRKSSYYQNKKMGEKKHKEDRLFDAYRPSINIFSEHGNFSRSYMSAETFRDIIDDVVRWWQQARATPPTDWAPETKASYNAKIEAAKQAETSKQLDAEEAKRIAALPKFFEDVDWVAAHYHLPAVTPNADYNLNNRLLRELEYFSNYMRHHEKDHLDDADSLPEAAFEFVNDDLFGTSESLKEQWEQLTAIIKTAWQDLRDGNERWFLMRGGANIFAYIRSQIEKRVEP